MSAGLVLYRVVPDEATVLDGTAAADGMAVLDEAGVPDATTARDEPAAPDGSTAHDEAGVPDEGVARAGAPHVEVLCAHMGGPLWARKDEHAWSFPKGELDDGEEPFAAARREFAEELGIAAPTGDYRRLGEYRYSSGKVVVLFAVEADVPVDAIRPGTFELEWPPRSGRRQQFPEVDRVAWFSVAAARGRLVAGQVPALDDLRLMLAGAP